MPRIAPWPALDYDDWADTLAALHLYTQVVGKIRLASTPWINHSWHCTLYVTPAGLTTMAIHQGPRCFDIEFDLRNHVLTVRTGDGESRILSLEPRSVASFHAELLAHVRDLGFDADIHGTPNELPEPIPFAEDRAPRPWDREAIGRFNQALNQSARVFTRFRSRFTGKCSPVHFFWGSFDLAVTRFSGRAAPAHPGGIPALPDWVTREAYSHEVYSCGFWPGNATSPAPAYYAYAYPVPAGCDAHPVGPAEAFWSPEMGEWFLPYEAVRAAEDPDAALMGFLQSTYDAVADLAQWDRAMLEVSEGFPRNA